MLGGNGYNESSFVKIDAVAKTTKGTVVAVPEYKGDASKVSKVSAGTLKVLRARRNLVFQVEAKGAGLNKFFPGRPAVFTIDTGLAGG